MRHNNTNTSGWKAYLRAVDGAFGNASQSVKEELVRFKAFSNQNARRRAKRNEGN